MFSPPEMPHCAKKVIFVGIVFLVIFLVAIFLCFGWFWVPKSFQKRKDGTPFWSSKPFFLRSLRFFSIFPAKISKFVRIRPKSIENSIKFNLNSTENPKPDSPIFPKVHTHHYLTNPQKKWAGGVSALPLQLMKFMVGDSAKIQKKTKIKEI